MKYNLKLIKKYAVLHCVMLLLVSIAAEQTEVRNLENELLPFFESKIGKATSLAKKKNVKQPSQLKLFRVAALWKELSIQFKSTYLQALEINEGSLVYYSPGFGVEIYYSRSGLDSV